MISINLQPAEKPTLDPDLDVIDIWKTIQGEGPFAGRPAVFVRLAGCNLQCPLCDTDYTKGRLQHDVAAVVKRVVRAWDNTGWRLERQLPLVVLTGGEPFRQHLTPLILRLNELGYGVQIETNGTLPPPYDLVKEYEEAQGQMALRVVCSPKTPTLNPRLIPLISDFKYVVENGWIGNDGLPERVLGFPCHVARPPKGFIGTIYVQPIDVGDAYQNKIHMQAAAEVCMKFGYVLCLQVHKFVGLK